jgi:hypothetical protein
VPSADIDANENTMCVYDDASIDSAVKGLQVSLRLTRNNHNRFMSINFERGN